MRLCVRGSEAAADAEQRGSRTGLDIAADAPSSAHPLVSSIQPLELWGHQGSPFVGMVREAMCSMELPYLYHNAPFGATKVRAWLERGGKGKGIESGLIPCVWP
jgi:hypothetical protein